MNTNCIRSRDTLMKAFAVAEMVASSLDQPPTGIHIGSSMAGAYTVRINFYNAPQHVTSAAEQHGIETTVRQGYGPKNGTFTEAAVEIDGVTVEFWALVLPEEVAA